MRTLIVISGFLAVGGLISPIVNAQDVLTDVATKQVAAPPADILDGVVRLPDPMDLGVVSRTAMLPVTLPPGGGVWSYSLPDGARAVLLPENAGEWSSMLVSPEGKSRPIERADELEGVSLGAGSGGWIAPNRSFQRVTMPAVRADARLLAGRDDDESWGLQIASDEGSRGYVLIDSGRGIELYTYAEQLETLVGSSVVLRSELSNNAAIVDAWADVRTPNGAIARVQAQGDAVRFVPTEPGEHAVRVHVIGVAEDGRSVELTTQHVLHAERASTPFTAAEAIADGSLLEIDLGDDAMARRSILAAEVWGERQGVMVPVCWLARISGTERSLTLDARWIALAEVDLHTIELREVRAHDVDSMAIVSFRERVKIVGKLDSLVIPAAPIEVTHEMTHGIPGRSLLEVPMQAAISRGTPPGHRLLLVHGYCSGGNPFTTSQFSGDIALFSDANQNRSNDQFALQILSQASPMKSFGVAGHSQGGLAALHLYTFYWSGMDWAKGERLIQSVGAPYQGTPLAGNAAVLGDLFGTGCGSNNDLSPSGAAQWLSTIPTSSRSNVWYWTTSFEDRAFVFDFCNIVSDLLLSDPDDGVIERSRGQLPGGNNRGHREGWCHTTGMRDPAQCTDASRNSEINERARR
ncbi:MAG: hypothetical protein AB8F26_09575 [Phycisphaerales bacterium]